jgi:penicillin amidase
VLLGVCTAGACSRPPEAPAVPVPQTSGTLAVAGLHEPVRIVRDQWGIPHIYATDTHDLFFAQGFVQAQDRLFQMDLWRRAAIGNLASVLGANFVARDVMTRHMQPTGLLDRNGDADWTVLGAETRAIAEAFVGGVNAWVGRNLSDPPEEFRLAGWRPAFWAAEDLLVRTDAFRAAVNAQAEILRANIVAEAGAEQAAMWMPLDPPQPLVVPVGLDPAVVSYLVGNTLRAVGTPPFFTTLAAPFEAPAASNAWAVAGRRSATGRPLLANDPHGPLGVPSSWYVVHLHAPGWNVIGATEPWAPGVAIGHNERVAWGVAALDADVQDLYVERVNPDNPLQVSTPSGWTDVRRSSRVVPVKGRIEPFAFDHDVTPHGVVVNIDRERHLAFALRWSGLEPGAAPVLASLALDRASSSAELRQRLESWRSPARTFVFADVDGTIGSQAAGLMPIRRGWSGALPVPGWTGAYEWSGFRTLTELPHTVDPEDGIVLTANERPELPTRDVAIGVDWPSSARAMRLRELLGGDSRLSLDDIGKIQRDVTAWNADQLVPLLENVQSADENIERARRQLLGWKREVAADSAAASLYVAWEQALVQRLIGPHLSRALADTWVDVVGARSDVLVNALTRPNRQWFGATPDEGRRRVLLDALGAAVARLAQIEDADHAPWGQLHAAIFEHPLAVTAGARARFDVGPFAFGGYAHTVMASGGNGFHADWGPVFRQVIDVGDWDRSLVVTSPGQSERPASAHFSDLAERWAAGDYVPLPFTDAAVESSASEVLVLE